MNVFILVFSCIIASAAFWFGAKMMKLYFRVKKWIPLKASVTDKTVIERKKASASRSGFKPKIEYKYFYNSIPYTGHKIFLVELVNGEKGFSKTAAERFNQNIPDQTTVYMNPQNPTETVMFCDGLLMYIISIAMGMISLTLGVLQLAG